MNTRIWTVSVLMALSMTGCATPYMRDRIADAKDIVTCSIQKGCGVDAQVGPVTTALGLNHTVFGLEDGRIVNNLKDPFFSLGDDGTFAAGCVLLAAKCNSGNKSSFRGFRDKYYGAGYILGVPTEGAFTGAKHMYPSYAKIDFAASLGLGLRVGFNPVELLDFILGWTTLDIYDDDIEARSQKEQSNKPPQATGEPAPGR